MDYIKVVAELREYLADLDAAILSVRRLENSGRRGRPPALDAAKRSTRRRKAHSVSQAQTRH